MLIIKKIFLYIAGATLSLAIYTTACIWIINQTLLRPQTIKSWIDKSGLYTNLIPTLSDVLSNQETDTSIPLKDTGIVEAGRAAFTDKILKQTTEQAIDQVTTWLESKDGILAINLNLSEPRTDFANGIGDYAAKRLAALPVCPTVTTASFDAFETTCLPKGINASAEGKRVANELLINKSFLGTGTVTNKTLGLPEQSNEAYTAVPKLYQARNTVFFASATISLLLSAAVVLLSSQRRKGVKRVARTYIILSIILFSSALFVPYLTKSLNPATTNTSDKVFIEQIVKPIFTQVEKSVVQEHIISASVIGGIGLLLCAYLIATRTKKAETVIGSQFDQESPKSPTTPPPVAQ